MKVTVLFRHIPNNSDAKDLIHHRLSSSLSRFAQCIDHVSATMSDVNGPKGGFDQQCVLVISVAGISPIIITEQQAEQGAAINRAISRAKMALARQLKRRQGLKKHAKSNLKRQIPLLEQGQDHSRVQDIEYDLEQVHDQDFEYEYNNEYDLTANL